MKAIYTLKVAFLAICWGCGDTASHPVEIGEAATCTLPWAVSVACEQKPGGGYSFRLATYDHTQKPLTYTKGSCSSCLSGSWLLDDFDDAPWLQAVCDNDSAMLAASGDCVEHAPLILEQCIERDELDFVGNGNYKACK